MFEQHPGPQQISSYQFRLVGDRTLKQLFQLAAGAVIGLIIYSLPLPGFLKWPLIALAVIGGAAFAFLPIQDRPLEQWLVAFFRSIYAPTIFVWKKADKPEEYFALEATVPQPAIAEDALTDTQPHDVATQTMEQNEQNFLSRVSSMFGGKQLQTMNVQPQSTMPAPEPVTPVPQASKPLQTVPAQAQVEVKPRGFVATAPSTQVTSSPIGQVFSSSGMAPANAAQFSPEAAPPTPPTSPNIIVGQVMDANGKIVEGAILEITDSEGRPVRALKTNRAGHFMIVTQLTSGEYSLTTEKEELSFKPVKLTLTGAIVDPIAIKSEDAMAASPAPEGRAVWAQQ